MWFGANGALSACRTALLVICLLEFVLCVCVLRWVDSCGLGCLLSLRVQVGGGWESSDRNKSPDTVPKVQLLSFYCGLFFVQSAVVEG